MVGKKMFKTKLCHLYQRGRCGRQSCSFAHGEADLRRHSGSFYGRQDSRASDSRGRLDRRHSTRRRYSPDADRTAERSFHDRSPPRSFGRRRKNQHVDACSDLSGSLRISNGTEDCKKVGKILPSDSRDFQEKLKHLQLEIDLLVDQKSKLQNEIEERTQEADSLSSRIQDLENQLSEEKEYYKRITSRIKKFVNEQNNHTELQDELKRSQARLNKLVKDFGSDAAGLGANAEDSGVNAVFDGETTANHVTGQVMEQRKDSTSLITRKLHINIDSVEGSKAEKFAKRGRISADKGKSRKSTDDTASNRGLESEVDRKRKDMVWQHSIEGHPKRRKDTLVGLASSNKAKGYESNHILPSTSMAAHVVDELEVEERAEMVKTVPSVVEKGAASVAPDFEFPLPPLPSFSQNNYSEYKGDDEDVDVDGGLEPEEELVEVEIV